MPKDAKYSTQNVELILFDLTRHFHKLDLNNTKD